MSLRQRRKLAEEMAKVPEGPHPFLPWEPPDPMVVFSGWTETQIKHQAAFESFDRLPLRVKRAFWQLTVTFDPVPVAEWLQTNTGMTAVRAVRRQIYAAEAADLQTFGRAYYRRFAQILPHLAARVSILRYGRFYRTRR